MYFFLKQPKSEKETLVYLIYYVSEDMKNFKFSTSEKILPSDWDKESRMPISKRGRTDLAATRKRLNKYSEFLDALLSDAKINDQIIRVDFLKNAFNEKFKNKTVKVNFSVPEIVQLFIDSKDASGGQSKSWKQKYTNLKKKLDYYEKSKNVKIKFDNIDSDFLDDWSGYLRTINEKPFKPHNDNTLNRNINFLFTFLYWSQGKYHNIDFSKLKNPVKKYQADDVYLTDEEIKRIENVKLPRLSLERSRDLFLIGVYSGQRFSDYSVFEREDVKGDMIIKRAEKTENESFIPLHGKLKALLDKYDWNLPKISGQKFNPHIQEVCKLAGIDESIKETIYKGNEKTVVYRKKYEMVSSHTARRTFITLSAEKGLPDHIIMKITGIRDPKTLLKYKKTSQRSIVEMFNKSWY